MPFHALGEVVRREIWIVTVFWVSISYYDPRNSSLTRRFVPAAKALAKWKDAYRTKIQLKAIA